jgi:hypothetical protein
LEKVARKRAEEEITSIRKEFRNAFVIAPFKWNGFMTGGQDLLDAPRLWGFSNQWCEGTQLFSKEQENTDPQLHAPANAALLEEIMAAKKPPLTLVDDCDPDDPDRIVENKDKYDENCSEAAIAIHEASTFISEADDFMVRANSLPNLAAHIRTRGRYGNR